MASKYPLTDPNLRYTSINRNGAAKWMEGLSHLEMLEKSKERRLLAYSLYQQGKSYKEIGADLGVCKSQASLLVKKAIRQDRA